MQTESIVNQAVRALNITRIIIAHRPETIRTADRVLVMAEGTLQDITQQVRAAPKPAPVTEPA